MNTDGVKFVLLGTTDMDRSVSFYRGRLGLTILQQFEGFTFFDAGAVRLVLTSDLGSRLAGGAPSSSEVVFGVSSVSAAFDELRADGVPFVEAPRPVNPQAWAATCRDPDGHLISFYGDP
jgi:catechol 2,3-dioxygenase-like lactoylglutathione lyase family enzyme